MKSMLKKTGLALAVASISAGAVAGDLDHTAVNGTAITLANEVFGTGSEETLINVESTTFTATPANAVIAGGDTFTVKYTLDKGAVFAEDLSDIGKWDTSAASIAINTDVGAESVTDAAPTPALATLTVTQGGAIGDNTVTFQVVLGGAATSVAFVDAVVADFKIKNLTSALARGVANPTVNLGVEFRNVDTALTDTDTALTILRSQDGVALTATTITDYTAGGGRARIDVADSELSFTGSVAGNTGANAGQDFDDTDNAAFVTLGTLEVVRTQFDDDSSAAVNLVNVKKEDANDFDFNGSDTISVTLTSTASLASYGSVYLRNTGVCDATAVPAADFVGAAVVGDANSVTVDLSGETTADLGTGYTVCAVGGGVAALPESTVTATLDVNYFNPRYTNSMDTVDYGAILRNGCQVTLFNVPAPDSPDSASIRLTNVSELAGAVRAYMWTQDGTQIDVDSQLVTSLAPHATTVLKSNPASTGNGYLGDNMPTYAASANADGRNRLVIQGAFPACEALGLVRTPSGVLTNLTSTTYGGDDSRLGTDQSGTSNTSN